MRKKLEIRVPISPTPSFFRRIHFMAASLQRLGGALARYDIVVCVGGDEEPRNLNNLLPWSNNYPIIWRWADREGFRRDGYWETSREIFREESRAEYVMCADADIIFVKEFSDLLEGLDHSPAVAGIIAHVTPFTNTVPSETWRMLCQGYGVPEPSFAYEHTGWGFMATKPEDRFTPAYFNFGMVIAPCDMMNKIGAEIMAADDFVNSKLATFFRFQIALTLAIQRHALPTRALPLRYNFPNDQGFDERYPEDLKDVRILHYLRCEIVNRDKDFESLAAVAALIARHDLHGSNEVFRRTVEKLYASVVGEERQDDPISLNSRAST